LHVFISDLWRHLLLNMLCKIGLFTVFPALSNLWWSYD